MRILGCIVVLLVLTLSPRADDAVEPSKKHWAFQPVRKPEVKASPGVNPVDALLGTAKLPAADPRSRMRRMTYDLTGLPPTPEEVDEFVREDAASPSPEKRRAAVGKLIDRLLGSPAYGEKWGRKWLDVARYADTAGENTDRPLQQAWRYRNDVIAAFNHDIKPVAGVDTLHANMGSLYSSIAGASRVDTAMPTNVAQFPRSIDPKAMAAVTEFGNFESTGELSRTFAPFVPGAGAGLQQDMRLNLPEGRFQDRRALLGALDDWKRCADASGVGRGLQRFPATSLQRAPPRRFGCLRSVPRRSASHRALRHRGAAPARSHQPLVCCGEMGRTPSIHKNGGRDHWGNLAPLLLYVGGLKMGRVIGQSSRDGGEPASEAVTMKDLLATMMHTLLDIGEVRLMPGLPQRVVEAMTRGEPIRGLV